MPAPVPVSSQYNACFTYPRMVFLTFWEGDEIRKYPGQNKNRFYRPLIQVTTAFLNRHHAMPNMAAANITSIVNERRISLVVYT